jgi:hypothetical protein
MAISQGDDTIPYETHGTCHHMWHVVHFLLHSHGYVRKTFMFPDDLLGFGHRKEPSL